ncbi:hypothetical protein [Succinivibrio dextrinosolvens]|uniref:hypothetical protein n=1 Tax=Succinivibrio dextrinosolvens TaxID=83771 RepID=UPI0019235679|nr:hypothetical protein [Succinivibrio dextrinosolvens]
MKKTLLAITIGLFSLNGCVSNTENVNKSFQKISSYNYPKSEFYYDDELYQQLLSSEAKSKRDFAKSKCDSDVVECFNDGSSLLNNDSPAHFILEWEPEYQEWERYFRKFNDECNKGNINSCLILSDFVGFYNQHGSWARDFLNYFYNEDLSDGENRSSRWDIYLNKACVLDPNVLARCKKIQKRI